MIRTLFGLIGVGATLVCTPLFGDSLAVLDENDPFYVDHTFPKLNTPQWIGKAGVDAVVVLAIDDMREPDKYETYLRPILDRLKAIDGGSHVSIMSNAIDPSLERYQSWLDEGVSLEVHTLSHPCPLLSRNDFSGAENTYFGGIDLLNAVPRNFPVAYRMPCCDSINSPSPRFYAELFNRSNPAGQFLQIDSSVMCSFTSKDPGLPRNLVLNEQGEERFSRYLPFESFVTTIENYPYPYLVGGLCWEFPCMVPSDWEAQNIQGNNHPTTVKDWKIALDLTVIKQGVFNLVFHPHGWIRSAQVIELIDYAQERYGDRVVFLNFREAIDRINEHLLLGQSVRNELGNDRGVRLLDLNADGFQDVVIGNRQQRATRIWDPQSGGWKQTSFPVDLVRGNSTDSGIKFARLGEAKRTSLIVRNESVAGGWSLEDDQWVSRPELIRELQVDRQLVWTSREGKDTGTRFRDLDLDGESELITGAENGRGVIRWSDADQTWVPLGYGLPGEVMVVDEEGRDNGVRFVDINGDGYDDLIHSNSERFSLHLFIPEVVLGFARGWSREVINRPRQGAAGEIPPIVRDGERRHNGAWFHSGHMWVQNEETAGLPDLVDRRSFEQLLKGMLPTPLSPSESIEAMHLDQALSVTAVATEPLVADPVYFDWSADGRLWVVEMGDYPLGVDGNGSGGGKIRTLRDSDGDGVYDESIIFLDGLNFPTGLIPWQGGVIVSAAPDIFFAKDHDGDGIADFTEVWYTGFREGNQQHRVNGFVYGLDNWVYGANGDSGGRIRTSGQEGMLNIGGRDFRFDPRSRLFEAIEGQTQFGRHRDDWGNWFGNNNPNWLWHYWFPERYLGQNPNLRMPSNKRYLGRDDPYVHDIGEEQQRFNDVGHRNHVTSGNSPTPYRDDLFEGDYRRSVFVSEPVHNVVHREVLTRNGVSFDSQRAASESDREFIASTDPWFRPTGMKTGPDGALYIADMYRLVIEHPEWIPDDVAAAIDLRSGSELGRIYRVAPVDQPRRSHPILAGESAGALVDALESSNGWVRDTAQRLLVDQRDPQAIPALRALLERTDSPLAMVHALWTMDGVGALLPEDVSIGLRSVSGEVRRNAVRLAEQFLADAADPRQPREAPGASESQRALLNDLFALFDDPVPSVRFQLALSLGVSSERLLGEALFNLARRETLREIRGAIEASLPVHLDRMIEEANKDSELIFEDPDLYRLLIRYSIIERRSEGLRQLIESILKQDEVVASSRGFDLLTSYLETLRIHSVEHLADYNCWVEDPGGRWDPSIKDWLSRVASHVRESALNRGLDQRERTAAFQFWIELPGDGNGIESLLSGEESGLLQERVLREVSGLQSDELLPFVKNGWAGLRPNVREVVVKRWVLRDDVFAGLIPEIEAGEWPGLLEMESVRQLIGRSSHPDLKKLEQSRWGNEERRRRLEADLSSVFSLNPDATRGAELFGLHCSSCHRLGDVGNDVGPDLRSVSDRSTRGLLQAIVEPNRAVESKYVAYEIETHQGDVLTGIVEEETGNGMTFRLTTGERKTFLRREIDSIYGSGLSLMPEGLAEQIGAQGLSDLIGFLQAQ